MDLLNAGAIGSPLAVLDERPEVVTQASRFERREALESSITDRVWASAWPQTRKAQRKVVDTGSTAYAPDEIADRGHELGGHGRGQLAAG